MKLWYKVTIVMHNPETIKAVVFSHSENRFKDSFTARLKFCDSNFLKLEGDDRSLLDASISMKDVKRAVWECGNLKSPGPDGFNFNFIKRTCEVIKGDDLIACLNKAMAFLSAVAASSFPSTNNQLRAYSNPGNQAPIQDGGLLCSKFKGDEEQLAFLADPDIPNGQATQITITNNAAFQTEDLDAYDSDCNDVSTAKAVLTANLSNYGFDVISEIKPTSYDGSVISSQHVVIPVIDDEEN
nr:hypothetical protein [Tanacetum cinerariifolium]